MISPTTCPLIEDQLPLAIGQVVGKQQILILADKGMERSILKMGHPVAIFGSFRVHTTHDLALAIRAGAVGEVERSLILQAWEDEGIEDTDLFSAWEALDWFEGNEAKQNVMAEKIADLLKNPRRLDYWRKAKGHLGGGAIRFAPPGQVIKILETMLLRNRPLSSTFLFAGAGGEVSTHRKQNGLKAIQQLLDSLAWEKASLMKPLPASLKQAQQ